MDGVIEAVTISVIRKGLPPLPEPDKFRGTCEKCYAICQTESDGGGPPPPPLFPSSFAPVTGHRARWLTEDDIGRHFQSKSRFYGFYGECPDCGGKVTFRPLWRNPDYKPSEKPTGFLSWLFCNEET